MAFLLGGVLYLAHQQLLAPHPDFFLTALVQRASVYALLLAGAMLIIALVMWMVAHKIYRGPRHAFLHARLLSGVRRALLESGYYIPEGTNTSKIARLPRIKLTLDNDRTSGLLRVENHVRFNKPYESINLSSCLGHFIVDQHYLSDSENEVIFEISDSRQQRQMIFESADTFMEFGAQMRDYELFIDGTSRIPLHHLLLVGMTGGGKTYALYSLILQMLGKTVPYNLYLADPKASSLAVLGDKISEENTAESVEEIIELLRRFHSGMESRKPEVKAGLKDKLDGTYADMGLAPHVLIIDEYSSFQAHVNNMDKKPRDEVLSLLKSIVMQGRQLGFFLWVIMQQSPANSISTDIRENLVCKIALGQCERSTLETCFGASAAAQVPNRKYSAGQGVFAYPGITHRGQPKLCAFPTLHFDVLGAITKLSSRDSGYVITGVPHQKLREEGTS